MHRKAIQSAALLLVALLLAFTVVPAQAGQPAAIPAQGPAPHSDDPLPIPLETPSAPADVESADPVPNLADPSLNAAPTITVWDEGILRFGHIGNPQPFINIQGNIRGDYNTLQLHFSLNGSAFVAAHIGGITFGNEKEPSRRLEQQGDFNVSIPITDSALQNGLNSLLLRATDNSGVRTKSVNFTYTKSKTWPFPSYTDWSSASTIYDKAQVVDGRWRLVPGGVKPVEVGYDRVVAIGDYRSNAWQDYEVTVPITVHMWYPNPDEPSDMGGVGIIARWQGHQGYGGESWTRMGAYGYYSNRDKGLAMWFNKNSGDRIKQPSGKITLVPRTTYIFKFRVVTKPADVDGRGPGIYSLKVWPQGQPEPDWNDPQFSEVFNKQDPETPYLDYRNGAILLVAHRVDATFGNVTVTPLNTPTYPLSVNTSGSGSVTVQPNKSSYLPGERITLNANPAPGYTFVGWSGNASGSNPTVSFSMPSAPASVTATFRQNDQTPASIKIYLPLVQR